MAKKKHTERQKKENKEAKQTFKKVKMLNWRRNTPFFFALSLSQKEEQKRKVLRKTWFF